jgi:hypothetical protein
MGEWVKQLLDSRHINVTSMATQMGINPKSAPSYWTSAVISDKVLQKMTDALGFDLIGMVRNEQARRMSLPTVAGDGNPTVAGEPSVPYQRRPASASDRGMVLMINLDDYDDVDQLRILKAIQLVPKRGQRSATGS